MFLPTLIVLAGLRIGHGREINVGFIYSGERSAVWQSERTRHVAELALQHVAESGQLPANTSINLLPLDTECEPDQALLEGLSFIQNNDLDIVIGPPCSSEGSALISFLAHPFFSNNSNMQIPFLLPESSFTTPITDLETKLHRRLIAPEVFTQPNEKMLVNHFGWHRIGVIYDIGFISLLGSIEDNFGDELAALVFFSPDYTKVAMQRALQSLKDADVKIIRLLVYKGVEQVICAAEEIGLLEPEYVWWVSSWLWSRIVRNLPLYCSQEQIENLRGRDGPFDATPHPMNIVDKGTSLSDVGRSTEEFYVELQTYYREINYSHGNTIYDPYVYDAVWMVAKNAEALKSTDKNSRLQNFFNSVRENAFNGVSGRVSFIGTEPEFGSYKMIRLRGWNWELPPEELATVGLRGVQIIKNINWVLGEVPLDYTPQVIVHFKEQVINIDTSSVVCFDAIAAFMIAVLLLILLVNVRFRNHKLIRLTSPVMNNVILIGAIVLMFAIIVHSLEAFTEDVNKATWICQSRVALVLSGFTIGFGALFAKAWRVYRAFTGGQGVVITDKQLLVQVLGFLLVDISLFAAWQVTWPIEAISVNATLEETQITDLEMRVVQWKVIQCESEHPYLLYALLAEKTLLLLFGGFIAFETRNVHIETFNDSKSIGISIYNAGFCCAFALISSVILTENPAVSFALHSGIEIFCTFFTTAVIFGPRIIGLMKDPSGESVQVKSVKK